jgi:hypothetical protein
MTMSARKILLMTTTMMIAKIAGQMSMDMSRKLIGKKIAGTMTMKPKIRFMAMNLRKTGMMIMRPRKKTGLMIMRPRMIGHMIMSQKMIGLMIMTQSTITSKKKIGLMIMNTRKICMSMITTMTTKIFASD